MYISYVVQTGIALAAFLCTLMLKSGNYHLCRALLALRYGWEAAGKKAQWIRVGSRKHLSRLAVALTDFQKAQCFFMLAINIAVQAAIRKGGLQALSLQQLYDTYVFIKLLAISGYLPITFTLFTLHLIGMVSWYLIILSAWSVALSIVTLVSIGNFDPSQANLADLASSYSSGGPLSCNEIQLSTFCYYPDGYGYGELLDSGTIGDLAYRMLAFCLVVLALLSAAKGKVTTWRITQRFRHGASSKLSLFASGPRYWHRIWELPTVQYEKRRISTKLSMLLSMICRFLEIVQWKLATQPTFHRSTRPLSRLVTRRQQSDRYIMGRNYIYRTCSRSWISIGEFLRHVDYRKASQQSLIIGLYLTFSGLYLFWFAVFCQELAYFASNGSSISKAWNFGQVVALTVWLPPLSEYIHLELRGSRILNFPSNPTYDD